MSNHLFKNSINIPPGSETSECLNGSEREERSQSVNSSEITDPGRGRGDPGLNSSVPAGAEAAWLPRARGRFPPPLPCTHTYCLQRRQKRTARSCSRGHSNMNPVSRSGTKQGTRWLRNRLNNVPDNAAGLKTKATITGSVRDQKERKGINKIFSQKEATNQNSQPRKEIPH